MFVINVRPFLFRICAIILLLSIYSPISARQDPGSGNGARIISVDADNISLIAFFKKIEKEVGLRFNYQTNKALNEKITARFNDQTLDQVLVQVLSPRGYNWKYIDDNIYLVKRADPSGTDNKKDTLVDISGNVTDEDGTPLQGVSVAIRGTTAGTITIRNGDFILHDIRPGAVVMISSLGYQPVERRVNGYDNLRIRLKRSVSKIETVEVVSTGYQILPKERATGVFTKIDNKTYNQQVGANVLNRLDGVTSGILFDKKTNAQKKLNFRVRGLSTINGPQDPLIIVDNFPYEGDIDNLNPNDVESVTVLKDAAAASIWGARAGNGVVIITTKKGKYNRPLSISFNSNLQITPKPDLFYLPQMSSKDYVDVEQMLFDNDFYTSSIEDLNRPALSPIVELLIKRKNGDATADAQIEALRNSDVRNDFNKHVYRNAVNQQYSLNMSGGTEDVSYYFSAGYDRNADQLDAKYNRLTLRSHNTFKLTKKLLFSAGLTYSQSAGKSGMIGYEDLRSKKGAAYPYTKLADQQGTPLPFNYAYRQAYLDTAGGGKLLNWNYYPLEEWKYNNTTSSVANVLINTGLEYQLLPGLKLDIKYQYERQQTNIRNLQGIESYAARDQVNSFTAMNGDGTVSYPFPKGGILNSGTQLLQSHNFRGGLNYNIRINKHEIAAIAGGEVRQVATTSNSSRLLGYDDETLTYASNIDFATYYPTFISGSYSNITNPVTLTGLLNRFLSAYANASYTYDDKYIFSGSVRKDQSNLFGVKSNEKGVPLWSAGLGYIISGENFYHLDFLPYLKLRATYGLSGNVDQSRSALTTIRYSIYTQYTNFPSASVFQFANPSLRWEKVKQTNIGFDFGFRDNKITGSFDYYIKKGLDLLGAAPIDATTGLNVEAITRNVASMEGKGIELTINSENISGKDFKWNTAFLFNHNNSKTSRYYNTKTVNSSYLNSGDEITPVEGRNLYSIIRYKWAGLDPSNGDPVGMLHGKESKDYAAIFSSGNLDDLRYFGSSEPTYFGNIINSFSWKGIELSFNIAYKMGYYFVKNSINYSGLFEYGQGHADFANRWQSPGDENKTNVPSMVYPNDSNRDLLYNYSETLVKKADHIRLQYINLSYMLLNGATNKLGLKQAQIYFNMSDIGVLWKANKEGLDPDAPNSLRTPKSIAMGLRVNF